MLSGKIKEFQLDNGKAQQSLIHIKNFKAAENKLPKISNMPDSKTHWEQIYTEKSPLGVSWHQVKPVVSLQLIQNTRIADDAWIFDVGGGSSTLVDYLLEKGFSKIAVLDISDKALSYTRDRLGDRADLVDWYCEDITSFSPPHRFSLWHDRAVFHFLTDASDRKKYIDVLNASLSENGHLIIAAFSIGGPTKCSGLDIVQYDAEKLTGELGSGFILVEQHHALHPTPSGKQQQFSYFHFIKLS